MSYARRGTDSDVYVFLSTYGVLECCGCRLLGNASAETVVKTADMLAHLAQHEAAGDLVPDYCVKRLKEDAADNDAWMFEQHTTRRTDARD